MADSSLDDFFAKKDKGKKKKPSKAEGDDGSKQTKKDKKKKERDSGLGLNNTSNKKDDDEWKDFEEEKKADYTGLRIQTLQIAAKEEQDKESAEGDDDGNDEDGENRGRKDGSGPWAKTNSSNATSEPAPPVADIPKETTPAPKGPSKYIPPSMRQAAAMSSSPMQTIGGPRRKKEAPNVNSEVDFPTLGGAPARNMGSDYIDTTGGRKGVSLTLENKFSALQD